MLFMTSPGSGLKGGDGLLLFADEKNRRIYYTTCKAKRHVTNVYCGGICPYSFVGGTWESLKTDRSGRAHGYHYCKHPKLSILLRKTLAFSIKIKILQQDSGTMLIKFFANWNVVISPP
jgi:hypothetical protein